MQCLELQQPSYYPVVLCTKMESQIPTDDSRKIAAQAYAALLRNEASLQTINLQTCFEQTINVLSFSPTTNSGCLMLATEHILADRHGVTQGLVSKAEMASIALNRDS